MPQIFRIAGYLVFLWSFEGNPLEPIHFHITDGVPSEECTKIWLTSTGQCLVSHNKSHVPEIKLRNILKIASARHSDIEAAWMERFGEIHYFC